WTAEDLAELTPTLQLPTPKESRVWSSVLGNWNLSVGSWLRAIFPAVRACGPWFEQTVFAWPSGPEDPSYYSGDIGIFQSTYDRKYLVVAWRTLAGKPLTSAERLAYLPRAESKAPKPDAVWLTARRATGIPGAPAEITRE